MYLFFDGVSTSGYIWFFWEDKTCIAQESFLIWGNESSKATPLIDNFLKKNAISYEQIQNIITVVWPGSFTGIRTVSLIINTLAYIYPHISLSPVNFFDLYRSYPIVKASSKRDLFVKWEKSATIEVVSNQFFEENLVWSLIFWDINMERFQREIELNSKRDYENVLNNITLQDLKKIAPLYIKKPNIS